ncbi:hypothetical protein BC830DRAFT_1105703 [Chytriomyces sp. MP71]|nr:hypothetical protein BC830DRAFT_1105703 [Chytriomyces sp. MP71]
MASIQAPPMHIGALTSSARSAKVLFPAQDMALDLTIFLLSWALTRYPMSVDALLVIAALCVLVYSRGNSDQAIEVLSVDVTDKSEQEPSHKDTNFLYPRNCVDLEIQPLRKIAFEAADVFDFVEAIRYLVGDGVSVSRDQLKVLWSCAAEFNASHPRTIRLLADLQFIRTNPREMSACDTDYMARCIQRAGHLSHFQGTEESLEELARHLQYPWLRQQLLAVFLTLLAGQGDGEDAVVLLKEIVRDAAGLGKTQSAVTLIESEEDFGNSYLVYVTDMERFEVVQGEEGTVVKAVSKMPTPDMGPGDMILILSGWRGRGIVGNSNFVWGGNHAEAVAYCGDKCSFQKVCLASLISVVDVKPTFSLWTMRILQEKGEFDFEFSLRGEEGTRIALENRVRDALTHGAVRVDAEIIGQILF